MGTQEYLIGDAANLTGVSRDTLRLYEKRGIITIRKKENGYRYFTEDDIYELSDILYRRKMNLGLDTIQDLWNGHCSFHALSDITRQQMEEEKASIAFHQQALIRLETLQEDCLRIEQTLGQIDLRDFPRA